MKHNIKQIIFLWFCLLFGISYGQTGTLYRVPMQGTNNIVRYGPTTGKHVTYSLVAGVENHFSLTDMNTLSDVRVAIGLNVTDFEIIDGMVFFCGENGGGSGFLGWFDIDSLFFLGGNVHIDQTLLAYGLQTLDKIEVFRNPSTGNIHITGYGLHSDDGSYLKHYRAFEAVGTPASGMAYRTLDLLSQGVYSDVSDVVVTDNFVVYLSSGRNQACISHEGIAIFLQPFPKYDMFGTTPFYYHSFQLSFMSLNYPSSVLPINNDPYNNHFNGRVNPIMVHSIDDKLAVCTYRKDLDDSGWTYYYPCGDTLPDTATYITHYVFDLSALVSDPNDFIQMTSNTIAQLYNGDLYTLDGIEYEPQTGFYFILHRHESSAGVVEHAVTTFKMWSPVSVESSYQTAYNTSSIWLPTSMCMDGYVYYTVMGHDSFTGENIFWRSSAGSFSEGCDRIVKCIAKDMPPVPDKYYYRNAIPTLWKVLIFDKLDVSSVIVYPCEKICH